MDAGPFLVLGAWAPQPTPVVTKADYAQPHSSQITSTACKAVDTQPKQIPTKPSIARHSKAARMRGPGREVVPADSTKGAITCPRPDAKADSGSDETPVDFGSRNGLGGRTSASRRGQGSASSSPTQGSIAQPEQPTVAEVLRMAKMFLQPTHAVERQFYADCYRACQVMPTSASSRAPAAAAAAGATAPSAESAARGGGPVPPPGASPQPPPGNSPQPPLPYLSSVPEVALRLSCLGHRVVVRRVTDSRQYWSRSMTNLFCYSVLPGTGIGYVLDPGFKEHFRAGRMSDRYRDIWECLPPLFVGPPAKLVQLVQVLCAELQASFESSHRQLPPWRTFSCTINRWMSPVFRDLPVPLRRAMPGPGPATATAAPGGGGGGGVAGSTAAGMIPAADAQAFLRACDELLAGTASARPGGARVVPPAGIVTGGSSSSSTASGYAAGGGSSRAGAAAAVGVAAAAATAAAAAGRSSGTGSGSSSSGSDRGIQDHGGSGGGVSAATTAPRGDGGGGGDDARRQALYGGGDGGTTVTRAEVPGGAFAASTAATAAASSAAWGPPPASSSTAAAAAGHPLRTVSGFEVRQADPQRPVQAREPVASVPAPGADGAPAAVTAPPPVEVVSNPPMGRRSTTAVAAPPVTVPLGAIAAAAAPAVAAAVRLAAATAAAAAAAAAASTTEPSFTCRAARPQAAPVSGAQTCGESGSGLLSRCLRPPTAPPADSRGQWQQLPPPPQQPQPQPQPQPQQQPRQ